MNSFSIKPTSVCLKGEITLLGDKSIAHRCIILSAISQGKTTIKNFPANKDCLSTIQAFRKLGISIRQDFKKGLVTVSGRGLSGLKKPKGPIFVGDSGTTLRLLLGVLAGQNFEVKLVAGKSLSQRPMLRVTMPLRMMGAQIVASCNLEVAKHEEYPPIVIKGGNLQPITYEMPVASAQVKSAILLAGLYAKGKTTIIERIKTRDHTERLLKLFKADIKLKENKIVMKGVRRLFSPGTITIPGDISSASFFVVLATLLNNSQVRMININLNPSRTGIIKVLKRMGADIKIDYAKSKVKYGEPKGDLVVKSGLLKGTVIVREEVPSLIDELPILMVAAARAKGRTIFEGINELRVKETDRIRSMSENLAKMGAKIRILNEGAEDKMVIDGVRELKGSRVKSFGDHRTAMSMTIAGLLAQGETLIDDVSCIDKSFPGFLSLLKALIQ